MEIKKLSLEINHRFDAAVNEGKILSSLGLLALSYPLEVGAAITNNELWYAARLVLFLPLLAPTGIISAVVLSALAKWKPFKFSPQITNIPRTLLQGESLEESPYSRSNSNPFSR